MVANHQPLLNVDDLTQLLGISRRHVYRLSDTGLMPAPVRLGTSVRWRREDIDQWLSAGCPRVSP